MFWKKLLKFKVKLILRNRDRSTNNLTISYGAFVLQDLLYTKKEPCCDNLLLTCGIFDIRGICQVSLWIFPAVSLGRYSFEENVRRRRIAQSAEMSNEAYRIMSFSDVIVNTCPIRLAAAGFFATGVGDEVMCYSCHVMHRGWQGSNDPASIHRQISPNCLHVADNDVRNVPIRRVRPVNMGDEIRRLMSFANVRVNTSTIRLAAAGFFATGVGDETMCFSCRVLYRGWQWSDDPFSIHRHISPNCMYATGNERDIDRPFRLPSVIGGSGREEGHPANESPVREEQDGLLARATADGREPHTSTFGEASIEPPQEIQEAELPTQPNASRRTGTLGRSRQAVSDSQPSVCGESVPREGTLDTPSFRLHDTQYEYPHYTDERVRLNSFMMWPREHQTRPKDLADAGFFYDGENSLLRCFFCGAVLRTWEIAGDPWEKHVRKRSSCRYVREKKGLLFILNIQQKREEMERQKAQKVTDTNTDTDCGPLHFELEGSKKEEKVDVLEERRDVEGEQSLIDGKEEEEEKVGGLEGAKGYMNERSTSI